MGRNIEAPEFQIPGSWVDDDLPVRPAPDRPHRRDPPAASMAGSDVVIAVMGVTGSGKSSFIRLVTGRSDVVVGDSLGSETIQLHAYDFYHRGTRYTLIDTPGFDDTNRPDSEITEKILTWLSNSYASGQRLNGVIYLHRITDSRMSGTALRNNRMFRQLVGKDAFKNVILATTFWEKVSESVGSRREKELRDTKDFWGGMHAQGAAIVRIQRDRSSSLKIVEKIGKKDKTVMQAQDEIINQGKSVNDTSAAREERQQAERLKREMQGRLEAERRHLQEKAEIERRRKALMFRRQEIEMQRKLEEERAATKLREERARIEAQARQERERRELEEERRRQDERRRREREELERQREEQERREAERAIELRRKFQREYVCIGYGASWPCDKCKGKVFRYTTYYHCCFCDSDRYFHCGACGNNCGEITHPYMTVRATPDDDCIVM